jgi:hypothetical protein
MKWLFTLSLLIQSSSSIGQTSMREIIVTADTSFETNNLSRKFEVSENAGFNGLRLTVVDNPFVIFYFSTIINQKLDGIHFSFYIPSGMPREKGSYKSNEKE